MPFTMRIKAELPKGDYPLDRWDRFERQATWYLKTHAGPMLRRDFELKVQGWSHKPRFSQKVKRNISGKIQLDVFPTGLNTKIYAGVTLGTRARTIHAKRVPRLRFQRDYTPHTTPGGRVGGPGLKSGPWISKKSVQHPGIAARKFEEAIAKKREKKLVTDIHRIIIRTFRP